MGTLALDIETASPFEEPPEGSKETKYFEWLSVAVAYHEDGQIEPDISVMFRRGGWEDEYTADLFGRLIDWCQTRNIDRTLTYYGSEFDLRHMLNWADSLEKNGIRPNARVDLIDSLPRHVDLAKAAAERHSDQVRPDRDVLPDWIAYELEGIDNDRIWYDDYDFNRDYWEHLEIDDDSVSGSHVGQVLGERYVDGVVAGLEETKTHGELERLLYDYSLSDITDLFALYESLGAQTVEQEHHYPIEEIIS